MAKAVIIIVVVIILGVLGFWIYGQIPKGPDYSKEFGIQGHNHIPVGATHPPYNSNPPTSGWHYSDPAKTGFYNYELPDEQLIHNLEHGHIWIAYRPAVSPEIINSLKAFASPMAVITPRSANDSDISLASWGRLDNFNLENGTLDDKRVKNFILRYENRGPEKVGPSAMVRP